MLRQSVPYTVIVKYLKDKNIKLTTQSVCRHKINHYDKKGLKPTQLQKKGIVNARKRANPKTHDDDSKLSRGDQKIQTNNAKYAKDKQTWQRKIDYENELKKLQENVDVVNEMIELLAISKDRVKRSIKEEDENKMVLTTTGNAIRDYGKLIKDFQEITSGMDQTSLRFAQLVQLVGNLFATAPLTDKSRAELLELVKGYNGEDKQEEIVSILPEQLDRNKGRNKIITSDDIDTINEDDLNELDMDE